MALLQGHGPSIPLWALWGAGDGLALARPLTDSSFPACNPNTRSALVRWLAAPGPPVFATPVLRRRDKLSSLSR